MAYIVSSRKRKGTYEIRESSNTDKGPRSRTLVSFRELTDEVIEKAQEKAVKPASAEELRRAARRAGAPVARERVEQAARELIAELARGNRLDPTLRQIPDPWISASTIGTDGRDGLRTTASPMGRAPEPSILLPTSVHVEDPC